MRQSIKKVNVVPHLPERLRPLLRLAYNLWFSWQPDCVDLFHRLDRQLWEEVNHNPVKLLGSISQERLNERLEDEGFLNHLERVTSEFDRYMNETKPYHFHLDKPIQFQVAYLSAEYGLSESLPVYSGGLGILSGDHLKSASDLNIPLICIGLLYQQGYFQQYLNRDGWQQEFYPENDFATMPVKKVKDNEGNELIIKLWLKDHYLYFRVWLIQVGRVKLYMLDTNIEQNNDSDRKITSQLYGGDREMRLKQEILLGIGGVKTFEAIGIEPEVFHMNEGHSAFASLERIRYLRERFSLSFDEARELVYASNVFTTHTPVPAGNDVFSVELIVDYFKEYVKTIGISIEHLLAMGKENPHNPSEPFSMPVLAIRLSAYCNGVSELHKHVSRGMWKGLWNDLPDYDIPIHGITNGIHIPSWISRDMASLFDRYLGRRWAEDPDNEKIWFRIDNIPDSELWRTHERRRERLVGFARRRLKEQLIRKGAPKSEIEDSNDILDPEALTIGFARRFATYKRAVLIFRDIDRLEKIVNNPDNPVQFIFAGKAHPHDTAGKEFIQKIYHISQKPSFKNKIVFLENYDMNVARYLVEGVDVWMNNPRRPLEACGTSGMKATANGALNFSVLDGWWDEAYNTENGWAIGNGEEYDDYDYQDEVESKSIYNSLEKEIVPLFFDRSVNSHMPKGWIAKMKVSMKTLCRTFNTHRMVEDYLEKAYYEAAFSWDLLAQDKMNGAKQLNQWILNMNKNWDKIQVHEIDYNKNEDFEVGANIHVRCKIEIPDIDPESVEVSLYYGILDSNNFFLDHELCIMEKTKDLDNHLYIFEGNFKPKKSGNYGFNIRILPRHQFLNNPYHLNKIKWF